MASDNLPIDIPYPDVLFDIVDRDLDASRSLMQRLLTIGDGLIASAVSIVGVLDGLAFANKMRSLALIAMPLVLLLSYVDAVNWVHFRRAAWRVRSLERLVHARVVALRETRTSRPQAIADLQRQVDGFKFGIERTFSVPTWTDLFRVNRRRARWLLFPCLVGILAISAFVIRNPGAPAERCAVSVQRVSPNAPISLPGSARFVLSCPAPATPTTTTLAKTSRGAKGHAP